MNAPHKLIAAMSLCAAVAVPGLSFGALIDRGGGLIYDTDLNVTWLSDANYAKTSGYDADGLMSWSESMSWAANLSYYDSVRGVIYDDWRLPTAGPVNGTAFNYDLSYNGNTDFGQNMGEQGTTYAGSTSNEMAHLNFTSLDNHAKCRPLLNPNDNDCYYTESLGWWGGPDAVVNTGPFTNFQTNNYWSGTEYSPDTSKAWNFTFVYGSQSGNEKFIGFSALAVRDGDVGAAVVPVPAALWLFGSGLLGLIGVARKIRF